VSQKAIEAIKRGKCFFEEWTDTILIRKFNDIVSKKDRPEMMKGGPYNRFILLVHVDEDMLDAERLKSVLGGCSFQTCLIDDIYVLASYEPREKRCPLLRFDTIKR
jgi:hypothetical protein